jgi:hypothetical protein
MNAQQLLNEILPILHSVKEENEILVWEELEYQLEKFENKKQGEWNDISPN